MKDHFLQNCPECGKPLPVNAQYQLCPSCLMAQAIHSQTADDEGGPPLPPPSVEEIGERFPQLEILECLGRGGMGVVYKARQKSLNRLVALKLLAPERVGDPAFAARFTREAQALASLSHPNIVTIHDFGQTEGFYYLLMEFVDGVDLRQLLKTRQLTPEEALAIVPPLCEALQFAHERGIVHRDIKPGNILLDQAGRVKIADFGIARMFNADDERLEGSIDENDTHGPLGTPGYSAPEQMRSPGKVDNRADIYSLGVVFYEMLTGELPGKPLEAPSRRVQIDVRLDEIVLRALEAEPDKRYQAASVLRTEVETFTQEAKHRADTPPSIAKSSRSRVIVWLYLVAAVCAVGNAVIASMHVDTSGDAFIVGLWCVAALGFAVSGIRRIWEKPRESKEVEPQISDSGSKPIPAKEGWLRAFLTSMCFIAALGAALIAIFPWNPLVSYDGYAMGPLGIKPWKFDLALTILWSIAGVVFTIMGFCEVLPESWKRRWVLIGSVCLFVLIEVWVLVPANWQSFGNWIWMGIGYPPKFGAGGLILIGLVGIGLTIVATPNSLGATWRQRFKVVALLGVTIWILEKGLFLLTHLKALGPGRPSVDKMDVLFGILWILLAIGLTAFAVSRVIQNGSKSGVPERKQATIILAIWIFILGTVGLLWVQFPREVDTPLVSKSPSDHFEVSGSTWRSIRVFHPDFFTYRFKVKGYAVSHGPRWEVPVSAARVAKAKNHNYLTNLYFGNGGKIHWSDKEVELSVLGRPIKTIYRPGL